MKKNNQQPKLKKISGLFTPYKQKLKAPQKTVVLNTCVVVLELCEIILPAEDVFYSPTNKTLHIKNSLFRSAILPHKTEIIKHLTVRLGVKSAPKDIV